MLTKLVGGELHFIKECVMKEEAKIESLEVVFLCLYLADERVNTHRVFPAFAGIHII